MKLKNFKYLIHERPFEVFLKIGDRKPYMCKIIKELKINASFSYIIKLIKVFVEEGLVEKIEEKGRKIKYLKLTDKGKELHKYLKELNKNIKWI